jgi:hypothetical protein
LWDLHEVAGKEISMEQVGHIYILPNSTLLTLIGFHKLSISNSSSSKEQDGCTYIVPNSHDMPSIAIEAGYSQPLIPENYKMTEIFGQYHRRWSFGSSGPKLLRKD